MDDQRLMMRVIIPLLLCLGILGACPRGHAARTDGFVAGDYCDPDDRVNSWTAAEKMETRDRAWSACKSLGASDLWCAFIDAAIRRESSGVASRVHVLGHDSDGREEYGLGPMGLSVRWHAGKWPGGDESPAFCSPEVSVLIATEIGRNAITRYGARDARGIQAIFGGGRHAWIKIETGAPSWWRHIPGLAWLARSRPRRTEYLVTPQLRHIRAICSRVGDRACRQPITLADLGRVVPRSSMRAEAIRLVRLRE